MADKRVVLTEEGLKKLEEKLEYLKSVRRLEVADRLKAAIALGDLSENSEYDLSLIHILLLKLTKIRFRVKIS